MIISLDLPASDWLISPLDNIWWHIWPAPEWDA
jgi:hypothetical protein